MFKSFLLFGLIASQFLFAQDYQFAGKHFLGSYIDCDREALSDVEGVLEAMDKAVQASGAAVLSQTHYVFPPNGITIVYALSESHASIHTYPEHGSCFVDLFTCGDHCSSKRFHEALSAYLKPNKIDARLLIRTETIEEKLHFK